MSDHWLLLPIVLFATLLRVWQINESLWLDELHSAWVVSAGFAEIIERAQIGNQSSLYFYFPWATTSLFGMNEWALRLPSLVAGVGFVTLAYVLAFQFTRSLIAASACSILATLDHNFLFYATETRPYVCVQLVAASQLYLFWSLQSRTSFRRRASFVCASVVLFYLHYTAILLLAGEIASLSISACGCRRQGRTSDYTLQKLAVVLLCIAALTIPAATHVLDIGSRRGTWALFINDTSLLLPVHWFSLVSYVVVPTIVCLVVGFIRVAITLRRKEPITLDSILGATFGCSSRDAASGLSQRTVTATFGTASLLACWLGVPLAIVWLLTVTDIARLYLGRYVIGAALAPVLFDSLCVGAWASKKLQMLVAGLIIVYASISSGMIEQLRYDGRLFGDRTEDWRGAVSYVNEHQRSDSLVFVRSGLLEADRLEVDESESLRGYSVSPITSIYRIDRNDSEIRPLTTHDAGKLTEKDVEQIEANGSAWFIINGTVATRKHCGEQVLGSLTKEIHKEAYLAIQRGIVLDERQFGHVGVFFVLLSEVDDQVMPIEDQPTSPNSIAPP